MATLHHRIRTLGSTNAKDELDPTDRPLVDSALRVMIDDTLERNFLYSGFCILALPYRKVTQRDPKTGREIPLKFGHSWGDTRLEIEPAYLPGAENDEPLDVPHGALARMVLFYLQTKAVKTRSPHIEVGPSMRAWMNHMGVSTGGKSYRALKAQMLRFTSSRITFSWPEDNGKLGFKRVNLIENGVMAPAALDENGLQGKLWADEVELNYNFFKALQRHRVPVQEAAVRELSGNALALDLYTWLAYRLHALHHPTRVSWASMYEQFGRSYRTLRQFKYRIQRPLKLALSVYEDANVDVDSDVGLTLYPSRPPIPTR